MAFPFYIVILALLFGLTDSNTYTAEPIWKPLSGHWKLEKGVWTQSDTTGFCYALYSEQSLSDGAFRARVRVDEGMSVGIVVRYTSASQNQPASYLGLYISRMPGQVKAQVFRDENGKQDYPPSGAALMSVKIGRWYTLELRVLGSLANGYVDGEYIGALEASSVIEGRVGFFTYAARGRFTDPKLKTSLPAEPLHSLNEIRLPRHSSAIVQFDGRVCPALRSYDEVLCNAAARAKQEPTDEQRQKAIREEDGRLLPLYIRHAVLTPDLTYRSSFPAFHHALFIQGFLNYWVYTGDRDWLDRAVQLADWNIAHSTPPEWMYPNLPYSTASEGKMGGFADEDTIMLDKPAFMALAYLRLFHVTGKRKYLEAACQVGKTLLQSQLPEGNWYFRVRPQDGTVCQEYTGNATFGLQLMDRLFHETGDARYRDSARRALRWLLDNPAQTKQFTGFYEDFPIGTESVGNWDVIELCRYLIAHRNEDPTYLRTAIALNEWIRETFGLVVNERGPQLAEQTQCYVPMPCHTGHWSLLLVDLWKATKEQKYRRAALSVLNVLTGDDQVDWGWYSLALSPLLFLTELLGAFPELATGDHLLQHTAEVQAISYTPRRIAYRTDGPSRDRLHLSFKPKEVRCDGKPLPCRKSPDELGKNGWHYDVKTGILELIHWGKRVEIR